MTEEKISITACAKRLSVSERATVSRQALSKYIKKHDLPTYPKGKRVVVLFSEIAAARQSFTREVQRGLHLADTPAGTPAQPDAPTSLDTARDAKSRKENAQAEREELALAKAKGELVDLAQVEAAASETFTVLKDNLLGPALSDTADRVISVLGLGDASKRPVQSAIRETLDTALIAVADTLTDLLSEMADETPTDTRQRFDYLTAAAAALRADPAQTAQLLKGAA